MVWTELPDCYLELKTNLNDGLDRIKSYFDINKLSIKSRYRRFIEIRTYHPCTQRRVEPDQCYFTVQITGSNFECNV